MKKLLALIIAGLAAFALAACKPAGKPDADVIVFYSPTCPHCHKAMEFLDKVKDEYPEVTTAYLNTQVRENSMKMREYTARLGQNRQGYVPFAVFGGQVGITGFGTEDTTGAQYIEQIKALQAAK